MRPPTRHASSPAHRAHLPWRRSTIRDPGRASDCRRRPSQRRRPARVSGCRWRDSDIRHRSRSRPTRPSPPPRHFVVRKSLPRTVARRWRRVACSRWLPARIMAPCPFHMPLRLGQPRRMPLSLPRQPFRPPPPAQAPLDRRPRLPPPALVLLCRWPTLRSRSKARCRSRLRRRAPCRNATPRRRRPE